VQIGIPLARKRRVRRLQLLDRPLDFLHQRGMVELRQSLQRFLKRCVLPLLCLAAFVAALTLNSITLVRAQTAPPEVRGVWMTINDSEIWMNRDRMQRAVDELARSNFNTIYPVVWNSGYVMYPSPFAQAAGIQSYIPFGKQRQDTLAELIAYAHRRGLRVIPWMEFGFMTPPTSELATLHPTWLTQQKDGTQTDEESVGEVVWLNPFRPEVQQFLKGLVTEVVSRYDVDGIQFDDHTSLPSEFGYDSYTLNLYAQDMKATKEAAKVKAIEKAKAVQKARSAQKAIAQEGAKDLQKLKDLEDPTKNIEAIASPMAASPKISDWTKWRANKLTAYVMQLQKTVKAIRPKAVFAVAPNPYDTAYLGSLQDWLLWVRRGIVDELIVQLYRTDLNSFMAQVNRAEIQESKKKISTGVGVLSGLRNRQIPMTQIQAQTKFVRSQGLGVAFFYYESLWDYAPEASLQRQAQFQSLLVPSVSQTPTP
jgi:uncharacterized lipoprotein YddW (UPF0748 family)